MSAKRFSDKFKVNLLLLCKLQKLMPVILCIISFLYSFLFLLFLFPLPHYRLTLISQGTVLSRFVGGPAFQKFRRENDPELGEVQKY